MKNRRYAAFVFCLALSTQALASPDPRNVQEIENGACWLAELAPSRWKIASFNDQSSGVVDPELLRLNLFSKLEASLRELGFSSYPARDFQIHFLCTGGGHELTLSLAGESLPVCVTTDLKMKKWEINANHGAEPGAPCSPSIPGELLFMPQNTGGDQAIAEKLRGAAWAELIESAEPHGFWVTVRLKKNWRLRENEAQARFAADTELASLTRKIFYNYRLSLAGTRVDLGSGRFPGFE